MKTLKNIIALVFAVPMSIAAVAQQLPVGKVPAAVKTSFAKAYPKVKVASWEKENGGYEASFKQAEKQMSAVFSADGKLLESEVDIKPSELPAAALTYLKAQRKGEPIKEAAKITKANGEINYEAEVRGKDLLFDKTGKYIKISND